MPTLAPTPRALDSAAQADPPRHVTTDETARVLRVQPQTVRRMVRDGRLPAVRVGRGYLIDREQLELLLTVPSAS